MNLIEDLMESKPASRLGIVAIDSEGGRRDWHFGELIARSAGLSGAFAARGVRRGDVVMTLVGNRIEWVLTLLACWRMGAVALPLQRATAPSDLEPAGSRRGAEALRRRGGSARRAARRSADDDDGEVAAVIDEDRDQEIPGKRRGDGCRGPGADRLHLRHHR